MSVQRIEEELAKRLTEKLKDAGLVSTVYTAGEFAQVEEQSQVHPAAAVIYNGYRPGDEVGQGAIQAVEFEFLVVLVTRNVEDFANGGGARDDVSPIFDALLSAVIGWRPPIEGTGFPSTFKLAQASGAQTSAAGFAYWPVAFTIRRNYRGSN